MPYGSKLHIPPTNYHLLAARQEPYKKAKPLTKNIWEFSGKKSQENGPLAVKRLDGKSKRTRQKNKRRDRKGESNDSPEIPDRGKTSDIPGLTSQKTFRFYISAVCDLQVLLHFVWALFCFGVYSNYRLIAFLSILVGFAKEGRHHSFSPKCLLSLWNLHR